MARTSKFLLILLLGFSLAGCATYYKIKVNGYTAPSNAERIKPGGFFYIMEDQAAKNPLLEAEVKEKIAKLLQERGYPVTTNFARADYYLFFRYGIGQPRSVGVPDYYGGFGWGFGWGPGWGWGGPAVAIGGPAYGWGTDVITLYDRWLQIKVVAGPAYRTQKISRTVWVGEAKSSGSSSDLRTTLNYLLVAAFNQFGKNTGKAISVELKENAPAVSALSH